MKKISDRTKKYAIEFYEHGTLTNGYIYSNYKEAYSEYKRYIDLIKIIPISNIKISHMKLVDLKTGSVRKEITINEK